MSDWQGKRYWIVGASEGLGRALAAKLSAVGAEVILSARSADRLDELAAGLPAKSQVAVLDVTDGAAVAEAASAVGDVDGVIYVAGEFVPMTAQTFDGEAAARMVDINLSGAARVLGHVLPQMVARNAGHIVLIGSLAGFRGLPGAAGYGASKAGLMSLAETLRADLGSSEILVQLANPGFIRTRMTEQNDFRMPAIMEPEAAAQEVFELMNETSFAKNFPSVFSWGFRLAQFLPDFLYYPLARRFAASLRQ
ncbi:SDR family NAD(P)-dependent oxidoreductase [Alphaproteobacteria bacterium KMM 3653]|uniref:SDR family NAD(P)-dependent oxidoreductase n=1 Tax=Harenicola maris TaxID=2841044 RepID=A0AAP2CRN9_9RHOB|nr:SDR family NAD(P)-dependent oxidoreductase [Harenicola maris]